MERTEATALMEAIVARGHAMANLIFATEDVTLTRNEPEVLELGIASGASAAFEILIERGLLRREEPTDG